jgi:hypothetical protein
LDIEINSFEKNFPVETLGEWIFYLKDAEFHELIGIKQEAGLYFVDQKSSIVGKQRSCSPLSQ